MDQCICIDCPNKCYEYEERIISDKGYWEWTRKEDKCVAEIVQRYRLDPETVDKMTTYILNKIPEPYQHALTEAPKPMEYEGGIENV